MLTNSPREVVDLLKGQSPDPPYRNLVDAVNMLGEGQEPNHAARLNLDAVDIRTPLLESLPEDTRFLGLSGDKVVQTSRTTYVNTPKAPVVF